MGRVLVEPISPFPACLTPALLVLVWRRLHLAYPRLKTRLKTMAWVVSQQHRDSKRRPKASLANAINGRTAMHAA